MKKQIKTFKEADLKSFKISQSREKAKTIAYLDNFNEITIYNHVKEVHLKGNDVEYEINMNPRYAKKEKEFYDELDSRHYAICKKANGNLPRLNQIINNANKDFTGIYQYIVFSRELVEEINLWLDEMISVDRSLQYGNIIDDIYELKKIFPHIKKKWLVIDGNSFFSTIHQIYIAKQKFKNIPTLSTDIQYWAKFYKQKGAKGKAYTTEQLSQNEYERDVQMLQFMSLVLNKNMKSWSIEDIKIFNQRLHRLMFAILNKNQMNYVSANDLFVTAQALKYLVLPSDRPVLFNQSKRIDYMTMISLFQYKGNLSQPVPLQDTTFNIKIFRKLIEGIITRNATHLSILYVFDCMNEVYKAMIDYQNLSLKLLDNIQGQSARDRLTRIDSLCKVWLNDNYQLKDDIINNQLSITELKLKLEILVNKMVCTYQDFINTNVRNAIQSNPHFMSKIKELYTLGNFDNQLSLENFSSMVLNIVN